MSSYMGNRHDRITELAKLEDGWLDGCGVKITRESLRQARTLADALASRDFAIFPTEDGRIRFEWSDIERNQFVAIETGYETDALEVFDDLGLPITKEDHGSDS